MGHTQGISRATVKQANSIICLSLKLSNALKCVYVILGDRVNSEVVCKRNLTDYYLLITENEVNIIIVLVINNECAYFSNHGAEPTEFL